MTPTGSQGPMSGWHIAALPAVCRLFPQLRITDIRPTRSDHLSWTRRGHAAPCRSRPAGRTAEYRNGGRVANSVLSFARSPTGEPNMRSMISRICLAGLGLATLLATGSMAAAETAQMKADLKGSTTAAKGDANVTYDTASK